MNGIERAEKLAELSRLEVGEIDLELRLDPRNGYTVDSRELGSDLALVRRQIATLKADLGGDAVSALRGDARIIVALVGGTETALLEIANENGVWLYGAEDWSDTCAPSFGWTEAGELRQHDGAEFYGSAICVIDEPSAEAEALLRSTWVDIDGVFEVPL